eukprot:SAG31_NODE_5457_length_2526_cov_1.346930_1_plen_109_part_00
MAGLDPDLRELFNKKRRAAGVETIEEQMRSEKKARSAEKRVAMGIVTFALMASASYAANDLSRFENPEESLDLGRYGYMFFNLTGATGCLFNIVFPGRLSWGRHQFLH